MKQFITRLFIITFLVFFFYIAFNDDISNIKDKNTKQVSKDITNAELKIHFLDVGEADCTLIQIGNEYVLIDSGNNEDGLKLVNYFKELGITSFKYVIGTHLHEDHIGGMDYVIRNFSIEHYYMPDVSSDNLTFTEVINELNIKNINWEIPEIDSEFIVGDAKFKVLWISKNEEDINDTSIVLKLIYKNTSYLFMADATKNVELNILDKDLQSDVLRVGHHGASTSTSAQFLKKVNPNYAVISVGTLNDYNHPHNVTLKKLNRLNVKTYRTDQDGSIILSSDGDGISFEKTKTDTNGN